MLYINIKGSNGFSLIELMVVIAIIALLSAIALPFYKSYTLRARVERIVPVIQDIQNRSEAMMPKLGHYPNAAELGFDTDVSNRNLTNPNQFYPSENYISFYIEGDSCGAQQVVLVQIPVTDPYDNNSLVSFACQMKNTRSTGDIKKICYYYIWDTSSNLIGGNIFPPYYNMNEPADATTVLDFGNTATCN